MLSQLNGVSYSKVNLIVSLVVVFTEEFPAHAANVNSVSLGHKSGRVLVTGGGDKKVNLWAVGKPNCVMVSEMEYDLRPHPCGL